MSLTSFLFNLIQPSWIKVLLNIKYQYSWNIVCPVTSDYATNNCCINLNICAALLSCFGEKMNGNLKCLESYQAGPLTVNKKPHSFIVLRGQGLSKLFTASLNRGINQENRDGLERDPHQRELGMTTVKCTRGSEGLFLKIKHHILWSY